MTREDLHNGYVKLTADNGVRDTRNGNVYSEVICKYADEKYFVEADGTLTI